jgi:hypothetical protein
MAKQAKEVGTVDKLPLMPEGMDEEEAPRLALKASEEQSPPCYVVAVMTLDMSEEEALRLSMEASHVEPPPSIYVGPWPVQDPSYRPPPPTAYPLPS